MATVRLVNVKKIYPLEELPLSMKSEKGDETKGHTRFEKATDKGVVAVQSFNLDIADQEFIVLVGPSGCGKSTTLRMIAGLEEISEGEIYIGDKLVNDIPPKGRDITMVFQNYALFPYMTVYDNMALPLKLRKENKAVIDAKVREVAQTLGLEDLLKRKPKTLSGGQRQRVAIGRAMMRNPSVVLMDEPLSNLDAKLRNDMRTEIIKLRQRMKTTFVYVTHDQVEAMTLGDRIVIMKDGYIQQIGTPQEVFDHPANKFVGGFIGTPPMNFFDGSLIRRGNDYYVQLGDCDVKLDREKTARLLGKDVKSQKVTVGIRPEHLEISNRGVCATVDVIELMGSSLQIHLTFQGREVIIISSPDLKDKIAVGGNLFLSFKGDVVHLFSAGSENNLEYFKEEDNEIVPEELEEPEEKENILEKEDKDPENPGAPKEKAESPDTAEINLDDLDL